MREKDTTKHVHRLHPYKGKFIPQLVEYFIDDHIDDFKRQMFFNKGDIILDPFSGSGTTLVQANELGIHSIGVDISKFNCSIANAKLSCYQFEELKKTISDIIFCFNKMPVKSNVTAFEKELSNALTVFNQEYFPSPEFKRRIYKKQIIEDVYTEEKENLLLEKYNRLLKKHDIVLKSDKGSDFLNKWYVKNIYDEIQ